MKIRIVNPENKLELRFEQGSYIDAENNIFPVVRGVPRICDLDNYTSNFGLQWNKFDRSQLDREQEGFTHSEKRFFAETDWQGLNLVGVDILEVGSGAGRFSKVVLSKTEANLFSIDYSDAVTANFKNNSSIAPERFHLFQSSIYKMPFEDGSFDKVFCFGVLQHTPNFEMSVRELVRKAKQGGEIVVDFYPVNGWWTKINAKYMLRPLTKRIKHESLLALIEKNIDWLISLHFALHKVRLGVLTRFLPVCNIKDSMPEGIPYSELRELCILDTFDQYSPEHDHPQKVRDVVRMFEKNGAQVTFSDEVSWAEGRSAKVVRALKI